MTKQKMFVDANTIIDHGKFVALGIVIGLVLIMIYKYTIGSKENLELPEENDIPLSDISPEDIPIISEEKQKEILEGDPSEFWKWLEQNRKPVDLLITEEDIEKDPILEDIKEGDEELMKELTQSDEELMKEPTQS
jgi:hypothetical protein